jgi:putative selenium metabolism hydrolase
MKTSSSVNERALVELAKQLIRVPSPSGSEEAISKLIAKAMEKSGFDQVRTDEEHNVLGVLEGVGAGPSILFLAHSDHADVGHMPEPFSGKEVDGSAFGEEGRVLYGRGACDMKGALASMIYAVESIKRSGTRLSGRIMVLAFTREELGTGEGLDSAVKNWNLDADYAVSGEATDLNVHIGHRGSMQFKIRTKGRTCHASNPARGNNAIFQMNDILNALRVTYEMPQHPFFGEATFTVLDIRAEPGGATPIVPDRCEIILDRRYFPNERKELLEKELLTVIQRLKIDHPNLEAEIDLHKESRPYYCEPGEKIVNVLQQARQTVLGSSSELGAWKFGIDIFAVEDAGIPCAGMGPGKEIYAHTPHDHVAIDDLVAAAKIYAAAAVYACSED